MSIFHNFFRGYYLNIFKQYEDLFDAPRGDFYTEPVHLNHKKDTVSKNSNPFPVLKKVKSHAEMS